MPEFMISITFKNGRVVLVGENPSGFGMSNEQAITLARAILVKLAPDELK